MANCTRPPGDSRRTVPRSASKQLSSSLPPPDMEMDTCTQKDCNLGDISASAQPRGWLEAQLLGPLRGPMVLPGAWAMGEGGLLMEANGNGPCTRNHSSTGVSTNPATMTARPSATTSPATSFSSSHTTSSGLHSSLSRMAEDWTASVGSYLNGIAAALTCTGGCASPAPGGCGAGTVEEEEQGLGGELARKLGNELNMADLDPDQEPDQDLCSCVIHLERRTATGPPARAPAGCWGQTHHAKTD